MDEYLYRFRSADRLLGKTDDCGNKLPGELENLEIFFASPEELNDPLEGYNDIYWCGDEVLWKGLLRFYLLALAPFCYEYLAIDEQKATIDFINPSFTSDMLDKTNPPDFSEICDIVFSDPTVLTTIKELSREYRKVSPDELESHLNCLQIFFAHTIIHIIQKNNPIKRFQKDYMDNVLRLRHGNKTFFDSIPPRDDINNEDDLHKFRLFCFDQWLLKRALDVPAYRDRKNKLLIFDGFPKFFMKNVRYLMLPRWYTACFMSTAKNSSIWGSYGDNHRGVCIQYRTATLSKFKMENTLQLKEAATQSRFEKNDSFNFEKISYKPHQERINFFESLGPFGRSNLRKYWFTTPDGEQSKFFSWLALSEKRADDYSRNFILSVTSKLDAWKHENEYRLILTAQGAPVENTYRKLTYSLDSIEGIIFGIKTPEDQKIEIIRSIRNLCKKHNRAEFKFYQARYNEITQDIDKIELWLIGAQ